MSGANTLRFLKCTLILVILMIFIGGLVMLIAGSVVESQIKSQNLYLSVGGFSLQAGSVFCILFGIFILICSLLGLSATLKYNYCLLVLYSITMFLILFIQFVTGITGLIVKNSTIFNDYVDEILKNDFLLNSTRPAERDFYQRNFQCCGWNELDDYTFNGSLQVPKSCCIDPISCLEIVSIKDNIFAKPCSTKIINAIRDIITVPCVILVTFSVFNLIGVFFAVLFARQIRFGFQYA